jgi:hypothetical protein
VLTLLKRLKELSEIASWIYGWWTGPVGFGALVAMTWTSVHFLQDAPLPIWVLVGASLSMFGVFWASVIYTYFHSPPARGEFQNRSLKWHRYPFKRVSFNFDNFLGGTCGNGAPVRVICFQAQLRVNRGEGLKPLEAYLESTRTGQRFPVRIECGNPYLDADQIAFLPSGRWYRCQSFFGDPGMTKEVFLSKLDGFDFLVTWVGGSFKRHFSRKEVVQYIDRFWEHSNPWKPREPRAEKYQISSGVD